MRFRRHLNEAAAKVSNYEFLLDYIKNNCRKAIKEYRDGYNIFVRQEVREDSPEIGKIKAIRSDRRPSDTPREIHRMTDDWFEEKYGWRARSTSLFCWIVSDITKYAKLAKLNRRHKFIVFPVGNYRYLWSMKSHDLYTDLYVRSEDEVHDNFVINKTFGSEDEEMSDKEIEDKIKEIYMEKLKKLKWYDSGALKLLSTAKIEVMIQTRKAVMASVNVIWALNKHLDLRIPHIDKFKGFDITGYRCRLYDETKDIYKRTRYEKISKLDDQKSNQITRNRLG